MFTIKFTTKHYLKSTEWNRSVTYLSNNPHSNTVVTSSNLRGTRLCADPQAQEDIQCNLPRCGLQSTNLQILRRLKAE